MAEALARVIDQFKALDADASGGLSFGEVPSEEFFKGLDADGDGIVTAEECRTAYAGVVEHLRMVKEREQEEKDREERKREGKDAPPPPEEPGKKGGPAGKPSMSEEEPTEAGAEWTRERLKTLLETDPRFDAGARAKELLRNYDRDPVDAVVAQKEYPGADADSVFRRYDRNRNGSLDEKEIVAWMKVQIEGLWRSRKNPSPGEFHYLFDLDMNSIVTSAEYAALRGNRSYFVGYDADGDGQVTYDEALYPERYRRQGRGSARDEAPKPVSKSSWELLDANSDGRISLEEFGGNESGFRRLDRNGDGFLTQHDS
jgi:Ca2+-binding EF-hand superfamily protein